MTALFSRFAKDESGATAIEYGLIAGLMAVLVITAFGVFGTELSDMFTNIASHFGGVEAAGG